MKVCKFPDFHPDNMPGTRKRVPALLLALALTTCAWSINLDDVRPVTLQQSQVSVRTALDEIARQSGVNVMYREDNIDASLRINLSLKEASLSQALSAEYLAKHAGELGREPMRVPREIDDAVARRKLRSLGVEIDALSPEQKDYLGI